MAMCGVVCVSERRQAAAGYHIINRWATVCGGGDRDFAGAGTAAHAFAHIAHRHSLHGSGRGAASNWPAKVERHGRALQDRSRSLSTWSVPLPFQPCRFFNGFVPANRGRSSAGESHRAAIFLPADPGLVRDLPHTGRSFLTTCSSARTAASYTNRPRMLVAMGVAAAALLIGVFPRCYARPPYPWITFRLSCGTSPPSAVGLHCAGLLLDAQSTWIRAHRQPCGLVLPRARHRLAWPAAGSHEKGVVGQIYSCGDATCWPTAAAPARCSRRRQARGVGRIRREPGLSTAVTAAPSTTAHHGPSTWRRLRWRCSARDLSILTTTFP